MNPASCGGSTNRKWVDISKALTTAGLRFEHEFTQSKGHATELTREAIRNGYNLVVAVGGDGTLNEVANGILGSGMAGEVAMGIIDSGTGSGFAYSISIPRDYHQACLRLANPRKTWIDVGIAEYYNEGQQAKRYFIDAASLGFDGQVVKTVGESLKLFRGTTPHLLAILHSWFVYQNKEIHLKIDDAEEDIRICSLVIANGKFLNKWMPVAPEGNFNDGLLEVIVVGDIDKFELVQTLPRLYGGRDIEHPKIKMYKAKELTVHSDEQILVQAGGELLGEGPATFRVLPAALSVIV
ncbi:MAG: diacylglycerol/lipid kinase family protein [Dehalococcoidia bacterium]